MASLLERSILEQRVLAGRDKILEPLTTLPGYASKLRSAYNLIAPDHHHHPLERLDLWLVNCDPEMMISKVTNAPSLTTLSSKLGVLDTVCAVLPKDNNLFLKLDETRSCWKTEVEKKTNNNQCCDPRLKSWEALKEIRDTELHRVICDNPLAMHRLKMRKHMDALVMAVYCSIDVPRLDLVDIRFSGDAPLLDQNCVWKGREEGGNQWKLQITKWNKVKHNGTRVQTFDSIMGHLLDISFKNIPRKFLFQTSKGLPYKKDYLCEALRKYNTNNRLLRYACSTHTWANSELTYAERDEVCRNMNHSIQVSLRSYNKPGLNNSKRPRFENPIIEN